MNSSPKAQSPATKAQPSASKVQSSASKAFSSNKFKIIKAEKTARYFALNTNTGEKSWLYREDLPSDVIISFYQRQFFQQESSSQTSNNLIRIGEKTWVDRSSQLPNPSKQTQTEPFVFVSKPGVSYIQKYGPFKAHTKSHKRRVHKGSSNKMIVSKIAKAKAHTSNPTTSSSLEPNLLKRKG